MAGPVIRIALVDDHQVVTHALRSLLESFADIKVVGIAASGEELLDKFPEWTRPNVVVVDLLAQLTPIQDSACHISLLSGYVELGTASPPSATKGSRWLSPPSLNTSL